MFNNIKKIIEDAYEKRGTRMTCGKNIVSGNENNFTVVLNSEDPFIGAEYFNLVDEVIDEIEKLGYSKGDANFVMDNHVITFSKVK